MIVLDKTQYAKNALRDKDLGSKPSETLYYIASYYLKNGLHAGQVRQKLNEFILQSAPNANIHKWEGTVEFALKKAKKFPIKDVESIPITTVEMAILDSLDGLMVAKLAFTLLVLAKYWNRIKGTQDSWVTNDDTEIMKMANITANMRKQASLYHKLFMRDLLQFSKKVENTNVCVKYVDFGDDSDIALEVNDMRNLGYQYLMYKGAPYMTCQCCGIVTKLSTPNAKKPQKYCRACAAKIAMKQRIDSVMRSRGTAVSSPASKGN